MTCTWLNMPTINFEKAKNTILDQLCIIQGIHLVVAHFSTRFYPNQIRGQKSDPKLANAPDYHKVHAKLIKTDSN